MSEGGTKLKAAVLIVSDTASKDASTDRCIPVLKDVFDSVGDNQWELTENQIVPDDVLAIQKTIRWWTDGPEPVNLIVTSGGTGFATKDVTPEVQQDKVTITTMDTDMDTPTDLAVMPARDLTQSRKSDLSLMTPLQDPVAVPDALKLISEQTPTPTVEQVPVNMKLGGAVLAEDVKAAESVPAFRASIVDGYAVKIPSSGKFEKGVYPVTIISHAQPGEVKELKDGEIARITTGAPLPPGADAVVMVEDTILKSQTDDGKEEKEIEILTDEIKAGENVREVGSDVKEGEIILKKGEGITVIGGEFGLLASVGTTKVSVYRRPVVGVLSTGDELIEHNREGPLRLGEVRDTNRPTLITAVRSHRFDAIDLGVASDKPGSLEATLRDALRKCDMVITSGGVSMGELDLLKPTIERSLGGTIHFGRVNMKPGKPTTFATVPVKDDDGRRVDKVIFSLPGNTASAIVCFHLFVLPSLHHQAGIKPTGLPRVKATLDGDIRMDKGRPEYHRALVVAKEDGQLYATSTGGQRSSRIGSFKGANALLCIPQGDGSLKKGANSRCAAHG
ncbi:hypothetical protein SNOG_08712 [Parastagonospora nodorum SN15]|uniref:MoaB/Mog domain-containing protein n=1 Tax=Phaeosphaeria nodorum (strain SN15 / ATCC MYA-4574 / FGSC 10173) TaxID=321614 RepID=Q0UHQ2_PHANO|nr:hypothetical protein SNOG_08712 [Parastagonospora nodorum SN15]EAT83880.2 hypothetical protein SNOG_08712 [Parastagonospora nodorum SN15]